MDDDGMLGNGAFIVGSGRCGSTFLSTLLNERREILSLSEFFAPLTSKAFAYRTLDGRGFAELLTRPAPSVRLWARPQRYPELLYRFERSSRWTPETLPPLLQVTLPNLTDEPDRLFDELMRVVRAWPRRPIARQYRCLFEWLRRRFDRKLWVERSGASIILARALVTAFPDAKFVHLHRDGRDVAMSIARHAPTRYAANFWLRYRRLGLNALKPPFRLGQSAFIARMERYFHPAFGLGRLLDEDTPAEELGAFWSELIVTGQHALDALPPAQLLSVSYEDLGQDPVATLRRIMTFLNPAFDDEPWLQTAKSRVRISGGRWRSISPQKQKRLTAACRPGLARLGYEL